MERESFVLCEQEQTVSRQLNIMNGRMNVSLYLSVDNPGTGCSIHKTMFDSIPQQVSFCLGKFVHSAESWECRITI